MNQAARRRSTLQAVIEWAAQGHVNNDGTPAVDKTPDGKIILSVDGSATINNCKCKGTALFLLPGNRELAFSTGQPIAQVHTIPVADFRPFPSIDMT